MDAKSTYKFLKPSLDQMTDQDKKELIKLISGSPVEEKPKKKKVDPVMSIQEMKKKLLKTGHFKNRYA